jgi:hypothetical protein
MTQSSNLGYYEYIQSDIMGTDEPVSCAQTQRIVNNLNHIYDEQAQHRINWVSRALNGGDNIGLSTGSGTIHWEATVPWMMKRNRMPANADVYVAGAAVGGGTTSMWLKMVPWYYGGPGEFGDDGIFFTSTTQTTTSATGEYVIDEQNIFNAVGEHTYISLLKSCIKEFPITNADSTVNVARVPMVKFIVSATNDTNRPYILGVTVREFV